MAQALQITSYPQALDYLNSFINYERHVPPSTLMKAAVTLERVHRFAERIGAPNRRMPAIHVAGSKGKGSVAAMVESICRAAGLRTGLYTSPHLVHVRERIQLDGQPISRAEFARQLEELRPHLEAQRADVQERRLTYFEVLTHLAFATFATRPVDVGVLEVGMGGRLDATTICAPICCGITRIELEHTRQLGDTHAAIAGEKAGIIKPGVPVAAAPGHRDAFERIAAIAAERQAPIKLMGRDFNLIDTDGESFGVRWWNGVVEDLRLPHMAGRYQRRNAAVAVALTMLGAEQGLRIPADCIAEGLANAVWPGRLERTELAGGPGILDGAHTPASVQATLEELADGTMPIAAVFAANDDKDVAGMLAALAPACRAVILTTTGSPRTVSPNDLAGLLRKSNGQTIEDIGEALTAARDAAGPEGLVLVIGSLYLVGRVKVWLGEVDPA